QGAVALGLLALHWALYRFASAPGVLGPWVRDANIGWYLDRLILHKNWSGSYATINCLSSAANTIFGMMAGRLLVSELPTRQKINTLLLAGAAAIALGFALSPFIPLNKKIWTASFALYSTGMTLLALLLFYWICDLRNKHSWARLFVIVGSNSIFIYVFHETLHRYLLNAARFLLTLPIEWWSNFGRMLATLLVLSLEIAICWWMYRRRIFVKL
ncbi:MAG: hypothetical protein JO051_16635, partial [Acidobacteriaceae bacterium]|nr:hypothetical protein [Acidobacteriaceae bacterium]